MKRFWKRNKLLVLTLLVLTLFVGSTYAYLVASDSQIINTFKFAQIDTEIDETVGNANQKEVAIMNTGKSSVYVRARVVVSGADANVTEVKYVDSDPGSDGSIPANVITVVWNAANWEQVSDGDGGTWYYYKGILPGITEGSTEAPKTPALITRVYVGDKVDKSARFEVDVYEESALTSDKSFDLAAAEAAFAPRTTP